LIFSHILWNNREFPIPEPAPFRLDPNLWQQVESDRQFLAAREENRVGFFWDRLIEYLTDLFMTEQLELGNEMAVAGYERAVRVMAAETRFSRRILAKWILERAQLARQGYIASYFPSLQAGVLYVLLVGPGADRREYGQYRKDRSDQLHLRCVAAKAAQPDRRFIVGIALDARGVRGSSEDFLWMDTNDWSAEVLERAEQLRQELRFFVPEKAQPRQMSEAEYPEI
jgi:hypothetical protein